MCVYNVCVCAYKVCVYNQMHVDPQHISTRIGIQIYRYNRDTYSSSLAMAICILNSVTHPRLNHLPSSPRPQAHTHARPLSHAHARMHANACTRKHAHLRTLHAHKHKRKHARARTHTHTCTITYARTHARTHTHTHTHTHARHLCRFRLPWHHRHFE